MLLSGTALFRGFFFNGDDMQAGHSDATVIIEPNDDAAAVRVDASMIGTGDSVTVAAAGDYREGFERPSLQKMADISDHCSSRVAKLCETRKSIEAA
jgi:hypothetical protein